MVVEGCTFETERLVVDDWHRLPADPLATAVAEMLTPSVTHALPSDWGGDYDTARAARWIADRDAEGTTLIVSEGAVPVGLVLLYEQEGDRGMEVRLGYLLAEHAWGRGLGGELLAGLVTWCRTESGIRSLVGGVAADNIASIRILERNGFIRVAADREGPALEYRLTIER